MRFAGGGCGVHWVSSRDGARRPSGSHKVGARTVARDGSRSGTHRVRKFGARSRFESPSSAALCRAVVAPAAPAPPEAAPRAGVVFELFAGHAGIAAAAAERGFDTVAVDWQGNRHDPLVSIAPLDLVAGEARTIVQNKIRERGTGFIWMAPLCGTFSCARGRRLPAEAVAAGAWPAHPLRSDAHVMGLPELPPDAANRLGQASILAEFAADVAEQCLAEGRGFCIENPASSRMWDVPGVARLTGRSTTTRLHHCMFGGARAKHTALVRNIPDLSDLSILCDQSHPHAPWAALDEHGVWRYGAADEAEYPAALCAAVAGTFVRAASGRYRPPLRSSSAHGVPRERGAGAAPTPA